ncbi:MAG TPA: hypothetical protein VJX67_26250, partial [Blastocatellia bacterium]|nr:hypothetical protein [Blastocatellia bacterium]
MSVPSNRPATTIGVIVTMLLALNLLLPGASQSASQRFSVNAVNPHGKSVSAENLEPLQGYLDPAPGGMDVRFAWGVDGGKGQNVKIADIENDWNLNHIDLLAAASNLFIYVQGVDTNPVDDVNHGTAVLGEL